MCIVDFRKCHAIRLRNAALVILLLVCVFWKLIVTFSTVHVAAHGRFGDILRF